MVHSGDLFHLLGPFAISYHTLNCFFIFILLTNFTFFQIFTHNLSSEVLGQRYGILVPITYRQIRPKATRDEMQFAHNLGWCVEFVRAGKRFTTPHTTNESMTQACVRGFSCLATKNFFTKGFKGLRNSPVKHVPLEPLAW